MKYLVRNSIALLILALFASIAFAQSTDEVVALVKKTKDAVESNAFQTFARINRAEHPYKNKDNPSLYVFVFDTDLNVVAHAFKLGAVGKNVKGKPDVKGKMFRDEMLDRALREGSGWVDYYYENPKTKKVAHKSAYFELANGSNGEKYVIGSGKYFDE